MQAIISSLAELTGDASHTPPQTLEGYEAEARPNTLRSSTTHGCLTCAAAWYRRVMWTWVKEDTRHWFLGAASS